MTSILPPIPNFIFTVFEPLSLFAGFAGVIVDPEWFIAEQIALSPSEELSKNSVLVVLQLGNIYLLLAMIGVAVLYTTTEPKVVRNFVVACLIADIGHLAVTFYMLGFERFVDVPKWNALTWGNIGATVFLLSTRMAYLLGLLGPDQTLAVAHKSKKLE